MKNIKIVIGANFGDEGKGITTDFFCKQFPKKQKVLNVRFNGGSQAGHTVVQEDGRRHVFHNFGAGSFNPNVTTYLTEYSFVDPISFLREKEELKALGICPNVQMDTCTNIILPYDIFLNQILEISRGNNRHGSCGCGIWECLQRTKIKRYIPLYFRYTDEEKIKKSILNIRDTYYYPKIKEYGLTIPENYKKLFESEQLIENFIFDVRKMIVDIPLTPKHEIFKEFNNIVFEGAQGLLLDWDNREYMPHLTASHTGLKNVEELLKYIDKPYRKEICYVTRTYFTRHGAGKFLTETAKENLRYPVQDKTNVFNVWQQSFRWGYFDLPLFLKTIQKDLKLENTNKYILSLAVTHCDETNNNLVLPDNDMPVEKLKETLSFKNLYMFSNEITPN